jgi:hypothetical protein
MTYRLGNQIEVVRGKHAAALYDHYRGRVQRIPLDAASLLEGPALAELTPEDVSSGFFQGLMQRGYVQPVREYPGEPFRAEWSLPLLPPLRTLSMELGESLPESALDRMLGLAAEAVAEFGLLNFVIVAAGNPTSLPEFVARLLALDPQLMVELLCAETAWQSLAVPPSDASRVIRIEAAPQAAAPEYQARQGTRSSSYVGTRLTAEMLVGNYAYFHLLRQHGESHGCLHVDARLCVFPDICERDYLLADLRREPKTVADIIGDQRTQRYWSAAKDGREKCRDCEFRYACPNPVAHRSDASDLASAPHNCGYVLETGRWETAA